MERPHRARLFLRARRGQHPQEVHEDVGRADSARAAEERLDGSVHDGRPVR